MQDVSGSFTEAKSPLKPNAFSAYIFHATASTMPLFISTVSIAETDDQIGSGFQLKQCSGGLFFVLPYKISNGTRMLS